MINRPFDLSVKLDTRKEIKKAPNCGSVYIRIWSRAQKEQVFYNLRIYLTREDFDNIISTSKTKKHLIEVELLIQRVKAFAESLNDGKIKTASALKERLKNKTSYAKLRTFYEIKKKSSLKHNTFKFYESSYNAIVEFKGDNLSIIDIDANFVKKFKLFYKNRNIAINSISNYLRALKAVFNVAINDKSCAVTKDDYPFERGMIQTEKIKKKTLNNVELKALFLYKPTSFPKKRAHDWFLLSYYLTGVNMNDILRLKQTDVTPEKITFYREKTVDNSPVIEKQVKDNSPEIEILIKQYRGRGKYYFKRMKYEMNEKEIIREVKGLTRLVNKHLKLIAKEIGINQGISYGWARQSFATKSVRDGFSKEMVSQALGHSSPKTIKHYWSGFEDETMSELQKNATKF